MLGTEYSLAEPGIDPIDAVTRRKKRGWIRWVWIAFGLMFAYGIVSAIYGARAAKAQPSDDLAVIVETQMAAIIAGTATADAINSPTPTQSPTITPTPTDTPTITPSQTPVVITEVYMHTQEVEVTRQVVDYVQVEVTRQVVDYVQVEVTRVVVQTVIVPQPILITVVVTATMTPTPTPTAIIPTATEVSP